MRDYVPGDSPQRIHWKAAARGLGLPVKLFSGASAADLELALDATQGDLEARLGQLCRWVLEADARGLRYALVLPGAPGRIGTGAGHRRRCLERLALYAPGGAS